MPRKPTAKKKAAQTQSSPPEEKRPQGRPLLYKPEYDEQQKKLLMLGATDQEVADFFGVAKQTIYDWRLRFQSFSDSAREGKEIADMEVAFAAFERAKGKEYIEHQPFKVKRITYGDNGKKISEHEEIVEVPVRKFIPPDPTSIQFWLKNRKQVAWRDRKEVEIGNPGDFARMQDEELLRFIQEEAADLSRGLGAQDESLSRVVSKGTDSRH